MRTTTILETTKDELNEGGYPFVPGSRKGIQMTFVPQTHSGNHKSRRIFPVTQITRIRTIRRISLAEYPLTRIAPIHDQTHQAWVLLIKTIMTVMTNSVYSIGSIYSISCMSVVDMAIDPRIPTMLGRNTLGFYRPGRQC